MNQNTNTPDNNPNEEDQDYVEVIETDSNEESVIIEEQRENIEMEAPQYFFYFIAAVKVMYIRENKVKEKTTNALMKLIVPYISRQTLNDINRAACGNIMSQLRVEEKDIKEAVIMNISLLGQMTEEAFINEKIASAITNEDEVTYEG